MAPTPSSHELLEAYRAGDATARDRLVERYMPLVRSLASRYGGRGEPLEDLVQVGSIGLLLADRALRHSSAASSSRPTRCPTIVG